MAWAKNGTPHTLASSGSTLQIKDLAARKTNGFLIHTLTVGGEITHIFTFSNNNNTDYTRRRSNNGDADNTVIDQTSITYFGGQADDRFEIIYGVNIIGKEKLQIHHLVTFGSGGAAASAAPDRGECVSKVDVTTNTGQYTRIDVTENTTGSYDTSSNLSALGSD